MTAFGTKMARSRRRAALLSRLGGRCCDCLTTVRVEFDRDPGATVAARMSPSQRMADYERAALSGQIKLRCRRCRMRNGKECVYGFDAKADRLAEFYELYEPHVMPQAPDELMVRSEAVPARRRRAA